MYEFVDVTEQPSGDGLPAEALKFNGRYIEDVIKGYRTLYTSGRECLSSEITNIEIGASDGSRYQRRRYPARTITVGYQLIADDENDFREKYNALNAILSTEQAELIFHDEEDKFFTGTWTGGDDVEPGMNSITSELTFYCADPFKYSTVIHEFAPSLDDGTTFSVDYHGTHKAFPVLEATMKSDNGFIGYVDENEHILQFGNVEEADGEDYKQNELQATINDFFDAPDDTSGTDVMHPGYGSSGTLRKTNWYGKSFLAFGSPGAMVGNANGGLRTITLPADSEGKFGSKNFYSYFHVLFYAGLMGQTGEMCINWLTNDNKLIAGVNFYKLDCSGNTGRYDLCANGKILKTYSYTTSHLQTQNPWFWDWGHCDLRKEGSKLTFFYWGGYPAFIVPEVENMECTKIQIAMKQLGLRNGNAFMTYMGIDTFNYWKVNVEKWRDVPNKFASGDTLTVDCSNGDVLQTGMPKPGLGAIGNDWESFSLRPGINQIKCLYSSFSDKPDFTIRYREVFK